MSSGVCVGLYLHVRHCFIDYAKHVHVQFFNVWFTQHCSNQGIYIHLHGVYIRNYMLLVIGYCITHITCLNEGQFIDRDTHLLVMERRLKLH